MYIWDNYKDEYYNLSYPSKVQIKKDLERELETFVGTKKQLQEKEIEINNRLNEIYIRNTNLYYHKQKNILEKFKTELFNSYKFPNIVCEKAYSSAYERGHSSGFEEVENIFDDIIHDYMEVYNAGKNGVE